MSHNDLSNNDLIVPSYLHAPMEESGLLVRSVRSVPMEVLSQPFAGHHTW